MCVCVTKEATTKRDWKKKKKERENKIEKA